jgi:hypothetical protein
MAFEGEIYGFNFFFCVLLQVRATHIKKIVLTFSSALAGTDGG